MVSCKHCSTPNSLDSTFCKRCGTPLPEDDVAAAQEKLTALIAEGNTAFSEGRTDEAMAVAESAIMSNPSSVAALSLKALCHERRGELAEALECADQIVDLNPDSELDKIKRNQLRTKLSVSVQLATRPPDRRTALVGAVATVVLVLCIGIGAAKIINRPDSGKAANVAIDPGARQNPSNQQAPQTGNTGGTQQSAQPPVQPPTNASNESTPEQTAPPRQAPRFADGGGVLPETGNDGDTPITITGPMTQVKPPTANTQNTGVNTGRVQAPTGSTAQEKTSGGDDPPPTADQKGAATQDTSPGLVDIQISKGARQSFGGSTDASGPAGGASAMDKVGIQRFRLGNYASAAASFEQALRSGGDDVTINQWLGRCYDRLGRKSDEIEAYKRCVAACQNAINKGSGNKDRLRPILDTCQQELKVLQGN
jgi:tetratricopeptide (TPR) repeat protein